MITTEKWTALASDVDGTILDQYGKIPERAVNTLQKLHESGVNVFFCTGRSYEGLLGLLMHFNWDPYVIAVNGSQIRNKSQILFQSLLSSDTASKYVSYAKELGLYVHAYVGSMVVLEKIEKCALYYQGWNQGLLPENRLRMEVVGDLAAYLSVTKEPVYKLLFMDSDAGHMKLEKLMAVARKDFSVSTSSSSEQNFEIQNASTSKGIALKWLARKLGIDLSKTIAIGDGENDIDMFSVCGLSVAMSNAPLHVRQKAVKIAGSNADGGFSVFMEEEFPG